MCTGSCDPRGREHARGTWGRYHAALYALCAMLALLCCPNRCDAGYDVWGGLPDEGIPSLDGLAIIQFEKPELEEGVIDLRIEGLVVNGKEVPSGIAGVVFRRSKIEQWEAEETIDHWIRKPDGVADTPDNARITLRLQAFESMLPPYQVYPDEFALVRVVSENGQLVGNVAWLLRDLDGADVAEIERAGVAQVESLKKIAGAKARAKRYLEIACATRKPSVALVTTAFDLVTSELPDPQRIELAEGIAHIIVGKDTPGYVRSYAASSLGRIRLMDAHIESLARRDRAVLEILADGFHQRIEEGGDDVNFEESLVCAAYRVLTGLSKIKPDDEPAKSFLADLETQRLRLLTDPTEERRKRADSIGRFIDRARRERN